MMRKLGVVELMFTSDGQFYLNNSIPLRPAEDVLLTVNFMNNKEAFTNLKRLQVGEKKRGRGRGEYRGYGNTKVLPIFFQKKYCSEVFNAVKEACYWSLHNMPIITCMHLQQCS